MLRAIKKTRIHEEVFSQIHELIKEGRFKGPRSAAVGARAGRDF